MADQHSQQPFPLAGGDSGGSTAPPHHTSRGSGGGPPLDVEMTYAAAAGLGAGASRGDPMADLERALELAAAYFGGDADVAAWAETEGASNPPSPTRLPPPVDAYDAELFEQQEQELRDLGIDGGWEAEGAADDALLPPPPPPLPSTPSPPPPPDASGLQQPEGASTAEGSSGSGSVPGSSSGPAAGGDGGDAEVARAADAAPADDVAQGLQHMHLDDIDAEPSDVIAPGSGPLSLEAALAQGAAADAAAEPAPPPIEPAPTDMRAVDEDPIAALQEAIEADKPKFRPSAEWLKMMESVQGELEEAAQQGQPALVPTTASPAAEAEAEAQHGPAPEAPAGGDGAGAGLALASGNTEHAGAAAQAAAAGMQGVEGAGQAGQGASADLPAQQRQEQHGEVPRLDDELLGLAGSAEAMATDAADAGPAALPPAPAAPPAGTSSDQERQRTFALLQPICSMLLLQRADSQRMTELLRALEAVLQEAPQQGLQQCLDYAMFPLLVMMDAIAATRQHSERQPTAAAGSGGSGGGEAGAMAVLPALASNRVAEAALACMLYLLRRCTCQSGESVIGLLHRLAAILALPASSASEELREQAVLCLDALAAGVQRRQAPPSVREALLGNAAAPLLGYVSSLLLQAAEAEAQRRSSGSRAVRDAALHALLQLLLAVAGPVAQQQAVQAAEGIESAATAASTVEAQRAADALAFFLPGLSVGLCKALLLASASSDSSGLAPVGPASSSTAAAAAVQALVTLLVACLGDAAVEPALHGTAAAAAASGGSTAGAPAATRGEEDMADADVAEGSRDAVHLALQQLKALSQRARGAGANSSGSGSQPTDGGTEAAAAAAAPPRPKTLPQLDHIRVERGVEWVQESAGRLHQLLSTALPPLMAHQRPAVREAVVQGCCQLLGSCSMALQQQTQEALLQLLLSAAQDEWRQVADPARAWLQGQVLAAQGACAGQWETAGAAVPTAQALPAAPTAFASASQRLLLQLVEGLPAALRSGDAAGIRHARQLASAIQVCQPAWFAANVVQHPVRLQQLLASFLEAFSFDASIAGMLLYAAALPSGAATNYTVPTQPASPSESGAASAASTSAAGQPPPPATAAAGQHQAGSSQSLEAGGSGAVVLLPRMPLGLSIITTAKAYDAVASALRAVAAQAAAADAMPGSSGTALRCLIDACQARLRQLADAAGAAPMGSSGGTQQAPDAQQPDAFTAGPAPWQLQAASIVGLLAELLLGASPAWQPSWHFASACISQPAVSGGAPGSSGGIGDTGSGGELESLAAAIIQDLVQNAIWSLPTAVPAEPATGLGDGGSSTPLLLQSSPPSSSGASGTTLGQQRHTAQQLGCNALLLRAAIECCGTAARALGPRFSQNGRLLRTALLPLLEKLGDGTQLVGSAADAAVGSICWWCGYGGSLQRLVTINADYVVDGMCRQLRQLDAYPQAPQLFTALLQQADVAPQLLPLLAEPARSAIQGLGILARRQQPRHVLAFLQTLLPVVHAAGAVARHSLTQMRQLADEVQVRWNGQQQELEQQPLGDNTASASAVTHDEVRRFFQQRSQFEGHALDAMEQDAEEHKVLMSSGKREHVSLLRRHLHAAGSLAQAVADAVSPLAVSQSLQVAVQSFKVCLEALRALAATTEAVELDTSKIQLLARKRTDVVAPDPDTPRLLPSVHLAWVPLVGALQDWRVSLVETALQFLGDCACLAGSFLRKRFAQDAVPLLQQLLLTGPARRNIIAPGQDEVMSPATVQRVQLAVLRSVHQVASCSDQLAIAGVTSSASDALLPSIQLLLPSVGDMMGKQTLAAVREQATQTYVALARIDPDAAWCQLNAALSMVLQNTSFQQPETTAPSSLSRQPPPSVMLRGSNRHLMFEPYRWVPPLAAAQSSTSRMSNTREVKATQDTTVPAGLQGCNMSKLSAMISQIEQMAPRWHMQVEALLCNKNN